SECFISFPVAPTKTTVYATFIAIPRKIHVHTTYEQVLESFTANKHFPCAYLNTQGSCTTGTPLIRIQGNISTIIRRYSFTLRTLVQYFVVLSNSIFLHFRPISNKLKKVVSLQRFWKVLRQINPYVSNKWLLKLPCAYLNTQESRHTGTPLIRIQGG
ncbi:hypothetical protein T05_5892, partial [Trichinella murrelli]